MNSDDTESKKQHFESGKWLGRHQAFSLVANRCLAADAECIKQIRDSGSFKDYGLSWDQYCVQHLGVSRTYAEQQIECFEEYGANYRRMAEAISITPGTFKLIASAVSDRGLEFQGEYIPLERENSARIAAAVKTLRKQSKRPPAAPTTDALRKYLDKMTDGVVAIANQPGKRAEILVFVERAADHLQALARGMREKTVLT